MRLPFVTRARYEEAHGDRLYWHARAKSDRAQVLRLSAEIDDRARSEADAREQLRALKASIQQRDASGRFLPKVR